jgi:hypothetical protein
VKGLKKLHQANEPYGQARLSIFLFDKGDFRPRLVQGDNEGNYILIKGIRGNNNT